MAAAAAYTETTDENLAINDVGDVLGFGFVTTKKDVEYFQAGLYLQHVPTGLWGLVNYGKENNDSIYATTNTVFTPSAAIGTSFTTLDDQETWYFKAGLRERWHPLGHTVIYGEYGWTSDGILPVLNSTLYGIDDAKFTRWGAGIVQEIDPAAMSIWLAWRHHEVEYTCNTNFVGAQDCDDPANLGNFKADLDDVEIMKFGALINF